jgi:sugar phosphate isomerase/epimerase
MQPGISSYTYTWAVGVPGSLPQKPASVYDLIDKANSLGITLVQVADNLPLEKLDIDEIKNIFAYAVERKVTLEFGSRGLTVEHTIKCLETAKLLNSPILRMVIDSKDFEPDKETIIGLIRDLLPEFKKRNIRLAIENHDRLKAREFEDIIQSVGSDLVGICLDSVNSMGAGEGFETVSEILLPYTINLHVKDFVILRVSHKMGFVIEGTPAGKGMLNIRKITESLSALNRCNSAILELWTPPDAGIEDTVIKENKWAEESIRYLKTIIK